MLHFFLYIDFIYELHLRNGYSTNEALSNDTKVIDRDFDVHAKIFLDFAFAGGGGIVFDKHILFQFCFCCTLLNGLYINPILISFFSK